MIKLDRDLHNLALRAIGKVQINHLFALSVVRHLSDGQVYTDSLVSPKAFLVKHPYGMSLLFGEPDNPSISALLAGYIEDAHPGRDQDEWLQAYPAEWNYKISELMARDPLLMDRIELHERVNFNFDSSIYEAARKQAPGLTGDEKIVRTTTDVFNSRCGSVVPWYFWRNEEDFCANGIGFTLMVGDSPASTAFSAFIHHPFLELGIETAERYRGKGYAYEACSALIEYCLENGFEPVWACRAGNVGSMKLAQKLGFVESVRIPYYRIKRSAG